LAPTLEAAFGGALGPLLGLAFPTTFTPAFGGTLAPDLVDALAPGFPWGFKTILEGTFGGTTVPARKGGTTPALNGPAFSFARPTMLGFLGISTAFPWRRAATTRGWTKPGGLGMDAPLDPTTFEPIGCWPLVLLLGVGEAATPELVPPRLTEPFLVRAAGGELTVEARRVESFATMRGAGASLFGVDLAPL